jgi:RNA-directed DNA polymerase
MSQTIALKASITARLQELGLAINERKSNVVYIDTFERWNVKTSFTFLGYDFQVRTLKNYKGEIYRRCMPGSSKKAMRNITQVIKSWWIHRSSESAEDIAARYNAILRG